MMTLSVLIVINVAHMCSARKRAHDVTLCATCHANLRKISRFRTVSSSSQYAQRESALALASARYIMTCSSSQRCQLSTRVVRLKVSMDGP